MSEDFKTLEGYPKFVTRLASKHSMVSFETKLGTMGLGLAGEAAEIIGLEPWYSRLTDSLIDKLINELGDVCWYVAFGAANVVEVPFEQLCEATDYTIHDNWNTPIEALRDLSAMLSLRTGNVADVVKKLLYHGKPYDDAQRQKLIAMLKEVMAAVVALAEYVCQTNIFEIIGENVDKLSDRYKSLCFTTEEFMAKEAAKTD